MLLEIKPYILERALVVFLALAVTGAVIVSLCIYFILFFAVSGRLKLHMQFAL